MAFRSGAISFRHGRKRAANKVRRRSRAPRFEIPEVYLLIATCRFAATVSMLGVLWAQETTIFRTDSRLVVLHATAEDKEGRLVMDLPKGAFQVYENGIRQEIKS